MIVDDGYFEDDEHWHSDQCHFRTFSYILQSIYDEILKKATSEILCFGIAGNTILGGTQLVMVNNVILEIGYTIMVKNIQIPAV